MVQKAQAAFSVFAHRNELKDLLIRRYWQRNKTFIIKADGVTAVFDSSDFLSNIFFWHGEFSGYEPAVCEFLVARVKTARIYADVGGNVGVFSILPALVNPNCEIFCFEPDITIKPIMLRNMKLNRLEERRITLVNAAVGDGSAELEYIPHVCSFLAKFGNENIDAYDVKYHAPMVRLDDYFREHGTDPDLLKIDIDGAELSALRGASRILKDIRPDMLLEVHPAFLPRFGTNASEVCDFLSAFNYRFFLIDNFRNVATPRLVEIFHFDDLTSGTGDMIFVTAKS